MFGRKKTVSTAARSALKDPLFACAAPGVEAVHVDYDPAIWVRTPKRGQDRTEWVRAHLEAFATDLGIAEGDERYRQAEAALDVVADSPQSHTCDFVSLQDGDAETGIVAYVDVVDEQLGLLEHGDPQAFTSLTDLLIDSAKPRRPEYYPTRNQPRSWLVAGLQSMDSATMRTQFLDRAYRRIDADAGRGAVHLYAGGFYSRPRSAGPLLRLFMKVDVQLAGDGKASGG